MDSVVIERLIEFCRATPGIYEVYHYGQAVKKQFSLVLAFIVFDPNKNITNSIISAVQAAFTGHQPSAPLDVQFFGPDEDLSTIKAIKNALVYKRN